MWSQLDTSILLRACSAVRPFLTSKDIKDCAATAHQGCWTTGHTSELHLFTLGYGTQLAVASTHASISEAPGSVGTVQTAPSNGAAIVGVEPVEPG
jgi:hypothetical protein